MREKEWREDWSSPQDAATEQRVHYSLSRVYRTARSTMHTKWLGSTISEQPAQQASLLNKKRRPPSLPFFLSEDSDMVGLARIMCVYVCVRTRVCVIKLQDAGELGDILKSPDLQLSDSLNWMTYYAVHPVWKKLRTQLKLYHYSKGIKFKKNLILLDIMLLLIGSQLWKK